MTAKELAHDVPAEGEGDTAIVLTPSLFEKEAKTENECERQDKPTTYRSFGDRTYGDAGVRIGPKYVAQQSRVRDVAGTCNVGDLLHLRELGRQTAVHADDFVVDHRAARETVEGVAELLPHLDREPAAALVVKTVDAIDARALVVPSKKEEVLRVLDLIREQEANNFQRLLSSIHIVAEEKIIGL
jgi:hypothetical protein